MEYSLASLKQGFRRPLGCDQRQIGRRPIEQHLGLCARPCLPLRCDTRPQLIVRVEVGCEGEEALRESVDEGAVVK
jgi:hypothetical protein